MSDEEVSRKGAKKISPSIDASFFVRLSALRENYFWNIPRRLCVIDGDL
jgi:hypothetical protein